MLVFLSDIHLTDSSSGTEIDPRAFKKFSDLLLNIIGDPKENHIEQVEVVLLGDIFDVIRSDFWLRDENKIDNPIRPWSASSDQDSVNWTLQMYTEEIVRRIINRRENLQIKKYIEELETNCAAKDVKLLVSYFIGNHDWLINRYPSTRQDIVKFLGMTFADEFIKNGFYYERPFDTNGYAVFARHGDYYDPFNFENDRNVSSLGDAIVIDLLNKFPTAVASSSLGSDLNLAKQLKEIDNVRPLWEIPAWIQGLCLRHPGIETQMHQIWNDLVDEFLAIDFVRKHGQWDLGAALRLSKDFSFEHLQKIADSWIARKLMNNRDDYRAYAYKELAVQQAQARYVVYGHTHQAEQVPINIMPPTAGGVTEALYFNTGTWRKVFEHTVFDVDSCEFIGWYVMTFLVFYLLQEKEPDRDYEVWSASLGKLIR
jgi:UDP-2,3-diacylglucosamine pyrophosphatase LpxH